MESQKGFASTKRIIIAAAAVAVLAAAGVIYWRQRSAGPSVLPLPSVQLCTEEAKVCPDGTTVYRTRPNCEFAPCPETGPLSESTVLAELKKLNIQAIGQPKQIELQLPSTLTGPNWGLKKAVCEEGGYNLSLYVEESVLLTSYAINEKFENEALDVWIISSGNKIACVYKSVRKESTMAPGIFPVKGEIPSVSPAAAPADLRSCVTDGDCACGVKTGTGECFFGNKKYVDAKTQCPDFCSGIDGKMIIKCADNVCAQTR